MALDLTMQEIKDRLAAKYDEVTLLEMLGIDATTLLDLAEEMLEEKREEILADLEADEEEFGYDNDRSQ